jgi:hypothetical protein
MDPRSERSSRYKRRLPRLRGDGPYPETTTPTIGAAPPPARGWTLSGSGAEHCSVGSPACAGMDPWHGDGRTAPLRLPRLRGDGRSTTSLNGKAGRAPPPARGWTSERRISRLCGVGSPACAGMDPRATRSCAFARGLPRLRGDGPRCACLRGRGNAAPPPARGWTPMLLQDKQAIGGSPRLRGDGPVSRTHGGRGPGSPACAGMDPQSGSEGVPGVGLPGLLGDGPRCACLRGRGNAAPPPARGWTLSRASVCEKAPPPARGWTPCDLPAHRRSTWPRRQIVRTA